jgi:hypothetical protein
MDIFPGLDWRLLKEEKNSLEAELNSWKFEISNAVLIYKDSATEIWN